MKTTAVIARKWIEVWYDVFLKVTDVSMERIKQKLKIGKT